MHKRQVWLSNDSNKGKFLYCCSTGFLSDSHRHSYQSSLAKHTGWRRINRTIYFCYPSCVCLQQNTYDNVRVAPKTLVKAVLSVYSADCSNERQSAKLSYCAIVNVLTNLFPAGSQDFFHVLNVLNETTTVKKLLECSPDRIVHFL